MKQKEFKKVIPLVLILMSFICLNCLKAKAVVVQTPEGRQIDFQVIKQSETSTQGPLDRITFIFKSPYHNCTHIFEIPKEIADASEDVQQNYVKWIVFPLCESAPPELREKSRICTLFLLQLALFDRQRAEAELTRWIQTWKIGTPLYSLKEGDFTRYQDYFLSDAEFPGVTPENMFNERTLTNPMSIYEIFYFARTTISAPASQRAVLRQTNGGKVTARGQRVTFVGTSGYQGANTPIAHQNNLTDNWLVVQVKGGRALIIKQNPIAVQRYQATGDEAIYDQSDIKASVAAWQDYLGTNAVEFADLPFTSYMCPVTLYGTKQSSPNMRKSNHQCNYCSVVGPSSGAIQFFVPSLIDVAQKADGTLDVGAETWVSFITDFGDSGGLHPHHTWLRSPLGATSSAATISYGGRVGYYGVYTSCCGVRPACWVKI
ncbi:MAG: hypothetical protein LBL38_01380 [Lactobacillales bacterium]|jgi:hypothetical protein|nr:hypothetical protein [Lactobacillales bacterium]